MTSTKYTPKHRALKQSALRQWKRAAALGATVPAALGTAVTFGAPAQAASQQRIHDALEIAQNQKPDEYEYGADGPEQFDCSGLTYYSYGKAGISIPRTSEDQADAAKRIAREDMRKGDLMFYYDSSGEVYHVGVFAGWNGEKRRIVLHAANEGDDVVSELNWDNNNWFAGTFRGDR
jgi:cell wall-associated NlpC family hydrolase